MAVQDGESAAHNAIAVSTRAAGFWQRRLPRFTCGGIATFRRSTLSHRPQEEINRHIELFGVAEDGLLLRGAVTGRMHSYGQWGTKWDRARTRAKLPKARYHDLRHHYASELLGHGVSVVAVASAMGDDPATVLRTYAHLTGSDDDRIRGVIGSLWKAEDDLRTVEARSGL